MKKIIVISFLAISPSPNSDIAFFTPQAKNSFYFSFNHFIVLLLKKKKSDLSHFTKHRPDGMFYTEGLTLQNELWVVS